MSELDYLRSHSVRDANDAPGLRRFLLDSGVKSDAEIDRVLDEFCRIIKPGATPLYALQQWCEVTAKMRREKETQRAEAEEAARQYYWDAIRSRSKRHP